MPVRVSISYAPISSKLQYPPGHLTVHRAPGGVNLNLALEGDWKGGEFEPDLSLVLT